MKILKLHLWKFLSNKEKNDIDEAVYAIFPSETQKDNEEAMVLFKSFENQGFENPSTGALDCEVVHDQELISIYSLESQSGCPQTNFQKFNETTSELFDEQEDNFGAYYMAVIFEDVQEYMNIFVNMHGQANKPIVAISFEDVLRTEEIEQKQLTLMKDTCLSVFAHQGEMIFHDFQDLMAILLQSSVKDEFVSFISLDFGFNLFFQPPSFTFFYQLEKNVKGKSRNQLLDWLHLHFSIT
jgi:hypothetical protein